MGWGTVPDDVRPFIPEGGRLEMLAGCRTLRPHRTARRDGRPRARVPRGSDVSTAFVTHNKCRAGAPHAARRSRPGPAAAARPRRTLARRRSHVRRGLDGPGDGARLHGTRRVDACRSVAGTPPRSCSPTPTPHSPISARQRSSAGVSAPTSRLLLAGARAEQVHGTVLADGPGLSGGPSVPTSQPVFSLEAVDSTPDPYALVELGRDLRPPDYAATFARLAVQGSTLDAADHRGRPVPPGSGYVRSSRSPASQRHRRLRQH